MPMHSTEEFDTKYGDEQLMGRIISNIILNAVQSGQIENHFDQKNFYIICGDRHWQYHSIHPTGFEEFSCGALVDANSRVGRLPGDPKSTDPNAQIKQPYCMKKASGGFLLCSFMPPENDKPAVLAFQFYDEKGRLLYHEIKKANTIKGK